ncbi:PRC-barrel domain-containing protein [Rhodocista pekingensis]|uniref:PRC-barrel domain-containing protein n=1 Tax=Rhodocista pekingensis TaxID=201185 RepID=A0ABW2KY22_9PROT
MRHRLLFGTALAAVIGASSLAQAQPGGTAPGAAQRPVGDTDREDTLTLPPGGQPPADLANVSNAERLQRASQRLQQAQQQLGQGGGKASDEQLAQVRSALTQVRQTLGDLSRHADTGRAMQAVEKAEQALGQGGGQQAAQQIAQVQSELQLLQRAAVAADRPAGAQGGAQSGQAATGQAANVQESGPQQTSGTQAGAQSGSRQTAGSQAGSGQSSSAQVGSGQSAGSQSAGSQSASAQAGSAGPSAGQGQQSAAQGQPQSGQSGQSGGSAGSAQPQQTLAQAEALLGKRVQLSDGSEIGSVEDLVIDRSSGRVRGVVLTRGTEGMGGANILVPWEQASIDPQAGVLKLAMSEQEVMALPTFTYEQMEESMVGLFGQQQD